MRQLVELRNLIPDETLRSSTQILAVSIDSHADSQKLRQQLEKDGAKITFPLLEDKEHKVIDRYGLLNPEGRGIPHPATYIIDKQGVVRWKFVEVNFKVRPANDTIITELNALQ